MCDNHEIFSACGGDWDSHILPLVAGGAAWTAGQMCEGSFHVDDAPEAEGLNGFPCLRLEAGAGPSACRCKTAISVVRLQAPNDKEGFVDLYAARYLSCNRGKGKPCIHHAEDFIIGDLEIQRLAPKAHGGRLLIYTRFQPCHFSGGSGGSRHAKQNSGARANSCTLRLLDYSEKSLASHKIKTMRAQVERFFTAQLPRLMACQPCERTV